MIKRIGRFDRVTHVFAFAHQQQTPAPQRFDHSSPAGVTKTVILTKEGNSFASQVCHQVD